MYEFSDKFGTINLISKVLNERTIKLIQGLVKCQGISKNSNLL